MFSNINSLNQTESLLLYKLRNDRFGNSRFATDHLLTATIL